MITRPRIINPVDNPLVKSPYSQGIGNANFAPPGADFIITEGGDNIITEFGDFMITET